MKVLRIRRGFTTNSSASSEWVPPQWKPGTKLPPPPGSAVGSSGTSPSGSSLSNTSPSGTNLTQSMAVEPPPAQTTAHSNLATNGLAVGGLLGFVALMFAAERLIRRVVRRNPAEGPKDD